jgi:hypothetical protein
MKMLEKYGKAEIEAARELSDPFPVGLTPAYIREVEEKVSKSGNEMLVVNFVELVNGTAWINDYIVDNEYAARKLKTLESAFGIAYGAPLSAWLGKKGVLRTEAEIYNGYERAKVAGYCKYDANLRYESRVPSGRQAEERASAREALAERALNDVPF